MLIYYLINCALLPSWEQKYPFFACGLKLCKTLYISQSAHWLRLSLALLSLLALTPLSAADATTNPEWTGKVIFMRHALAPGFGDPQAFRIDDCSSQRNLNSAGREQARDLGARLRQAGVLPVAIYSSQWCRCWQTAELLALGDYQQHPGLNSFFQNIVDREQTLARLANLLAALDSASGPYLMVTHQVVISAITGISPTSGGMVVYDISSKTAKRYSPG